MRVELLGQSYALAYTTGAAEDIARICPDGKIERLGEMIAGDDMAADVRTINALAQTLSSWGARREEMLGGSSPVLTHDVLELLTPPELAELMRAIMGTISGDSTPTIEAEALPKNGDTTGAGDKR